MSDNNGELGAFLAGFVIGGLVGAATALILAPQSGSETRSQLADRSEELRRAGEEQVQHYRELADSYTKEYQSKTSELLSGARQQAQNVGGQVQEQARIVLDRGKQSASTIGDQVDSDVPEASDEATEGDATSA